MPATRIATSATLLQKAPTEVLEGDRSYRIDYEHLGYNAIPYKALVDAMGLPSTIGTAIAAGAVFTLISSDSIQGDSSPETLAQRRRMIARLSWSAILFATATVDTACLQALYASPSFCRVISNKLHRRLELRTEFEPWPSWDFMQYIIAYFVAGMAHFAVAVHLAATILIVDSFKPYAPALISEILIGLMFFMSVVALGSSIVLARSQRSKATPNAKMEDNTLASGIFAQKTGREITPNTVYMAY
ncbi:hypothetical protein FRC00_006333 [Tulasnella sp. 408]|nr:hypothetical protein FRC00_006333 [Tulasnella sp. 408]